MINVAAFQAIAETFLKTPVTIRRKLDPAQDPGDRTGDNIVTYSASTTTVMGWFVDAGTQVFSGGRLPSVTDKPQVRVPIGTEVGAGDQLTINDTTWTVIDSSKDETYPIWVKVGLVRIE